MDDISRNLLQYKTLLEYVQRTRIVAALAFLTNAPLCGNHAHYNVQGVSHNLVQIYSTSREYAENDKKKKKKKKTNKKTRGP